MKAQTSEDKGQKPRLVADAAENLRELILGQPPGAHLGSLAAVAENLGVGIVTVQQAARILEHEGLLTVKRGPGGGYYGTRPDDAALERAFATYMRVHDIGYREAFEMAVMLDCDIVQAAARSGDRSTKERIAGLREQLENSRSPADILQFEVDFRDTLLQIVERPLLELLARVAMQLYRAGASAGSFTGVVGMQDWRCGRQRILHAIEREDPELAYFEAQRYRRMVLGWMRGGKA